MGWVGTGANLNFFQKHKNKAQGGTVMPRPGLWASLLRSLMVGVRPSLVGRGRGVWEEKPLGWVGWVGVGVGVKT